MHRAPTGNHGSEYPYLFDTAVRVAHTEPSLLQRKRGLTPEYPSYRQILLGTRDCIIVSHFF